jgi:glycine C-acetyltransferase
MRHEFFSRVRRNLTEIEAAGFTKHERVILSSQGVIVNVRADDGTARKALNLCANNYLGLAGDERVIAAACAATQRWGAGLSSVRFICGTQEIHKELEAEIANYCGYEDALLFPACFDANGGVFEALLDEQDAVVSDGLNHASIIDGIRLTKAKRYRFPSNDMEELERQLKTARAEGARSLLIATDGVFSMDGCVANLPDIVQLAERYEALLMVDDCHATGHLGPDGRGSGPLCGIEGRIDILSGTFGKTLGGAMGGFICARREVIALLRQRARPYLFSNSLAPAACGAALEAIRIARSGEGEELRERLSANTMLFRTAMEEAGFSLRPGSTPIVPVMLGDAHLAAMMAAKLLDRGMYVIGFSYPVVPRGEARIRTQLSSAITADQINEAVKAFVQVRDRVLAEGPAIEVRWER